MITATIHCRGRVECSIMGGCQAAGTGLFLAQGCERSFPGLEYAGCILPPFPKSSVLFSYF